MRRDAADGIGRGGFLPIVDKGDEINLGARRQHLEDVIRAHAISAVRRVGQPVREEQHTHGYSLILRLLRYGGGARFGG